MSDALDKLILDISRASYIQPKVREKLIELVRESALDAYRSGVQKGYERILEGHRSGELNVANAPRSAIDEAIEKAKAGELMPSRYFS